MRIIALEKRVSELESRFDGAFEMAPEETPEEIIEEIVQPTFLEPVTLVEPDPTYWIQHRGFGRWYVYGPGEIKLHERGLSEPEAKALAEDLNERDSEGETARRVAAERLEVEQKKKEAFEKAKEGGNFYEIHGYKPGDAVEARNAQRAGAEFEKLK